MAISLLLGSLLLASMAKAQLASPPPTDGPEFSHSPMPEFLLNPNKEMQKRPREELITVPSKPQRKKKKRSVITRPKAKTPKEIALEKEKESYTTPQVFMEDTRDFVSDSMVNLANRLDSFIGDKRADDELNRSSIRLAYSYRLRETYSGRDDREVRFNLRLPTIDKRLRELSFRDAPTPAEKAAAREEKKREREPWRFRTDVGLNVSIPRPQVFTRGRLRKNWIFAKWIPRFQEELGWYSDRSWVNNTQFNIDREIQKDEQLFRFVNEADWRITQKRFITQHGPSIFHNTSDDDVWSYNLRVGTVKEDGDYTSYYMSNYGVSISYRRNLQGQWLYGEITPALDWPKVRGFRRTPGISLKLESLFGRR